MKKLFVLFLMLCIPITVSASEQVTPPQFTLVKDFIVPELKAIASSEEHAVTVGTDGIAYRTTNLEEWERIDLGVDSDMYDILWDGKKYIAVGDNMTILISINGIEWEQINIDFESIYRVYSNIEYNGETYVIAGKTDHVLVSEDGFNWRAIEQRFRLPITDMIYDGHKFVAVTGALGLVSQSPSEVYSTEDGVNWVKHEAAIIKENMSFQSWNGGYLNAIEFDGEQYIAASTQSKIYYSKDLNDWRKEGMSTYANAVDDVFCIGDETIISSSGLYHYEDNEWVEKDHSRYNDIKVVMNQIVAVGSEAQIAIYESGNWRVVKEKTNLSFEPMIIYDSDLKYYYTYFGDVEVSSLDGEEWGDLIYPTYPRTKNVIKVDETYYGLLKGYVSKSNDKKTWNNDAGYKVYNDIDPENRMIHWGEKVQPENPSINLEKILLVEDTFISYASFKGGAVIFTSKDGLNWFSNVQESEIIRLKKWDEDCKDHVVYKIDDITYDGNKILIFGYKYEGSYKNRTSYIMESEDMINWHEISYTIKGVTDVDFRKIEWTGEKYIAIARESSGNYDQIVMYSNDGYNWEAASLGIVTRYEKVNYNGLEYVALGQKGRIRASLDGLTWNYIKLPTRQNLKDCIWDGDKYIIIGDEGAMLYSYGFLSDELRQDGRYLSDAITLKNLGLISGNNQGDLELDRAPTIYEVAIMLVRMMGEEEMALSHKYEHPYENVPSWASCYVGYLYKKNIISNDDIKLFASEESLNAPEFVELLLKVVRREERGNNYVEYDSLERAYSLRLIDIELFEKLSAEKFTRGFMFKCVSHYLSQQ